MIDSISHDLKNAFRQLQKNSGLTLAAICALALGIGANTTIFSTVDALLLNSQPFRSIREPARLMSVYERNPALLAFIAERLPVRFKSYQEWIKQSHSFEELAAYEDTHFDLTSERSGGNREPESVQAARATVNFFPRSEFDPSEGVTSRPKRRQQGAITWPSSVMTCGVAASRAIHR
jgi:putative ABC transport system permease protein